MKLGEELFNKIVRRLLKASGGKVGSASPQFAQWLESVPRLSPSLRKFLKTHSPKTELWAGAGCIFDENTIMSRNAWFPRAIRAGLLLIGSAPNGDMVAVEFGDSSGAVGYVSHEEMHTVQNLRSVFIPICGSLGEFLWRINVNEDDLPHDYFQAATTRRGSG